MPRPLDALPVELARQAVRADRPRIVAEAPAGAAALEAELAAPRGLVERRVVERRAAAAAAPRVRTASRRRSSAQEDRAGRVGVAAGDERELAVRRPATVDVPRIWRTASVVLLKPWMNASESWPPFVLQTSRPSGQASPPSSTNGPPSPRGAEAVVLERHDHERREEVVEEGDVDVRRARTPAISQSWRRDARRAVVVARRSKKLDSRMWCAPAGHRAGEDVGRRLAAGRARARPTVTISATAPSVSMQQSKRRSGSEIMREAWWSAMRHRRPHDGVRVPRRVAAERDRDLGVLVVGRAVLDAMAHRDHRHLLEGGDEPLRHVPLVQPGQLGRRAAPSSGRPGACPRPYADCLPRARER